ncbi:hypothetical protein [Spongiactinospora sp. TRM90649]|uniref:hypothetical protein n=1 Tax=Spongiactinospora sp. TRM90649 TaxID=3031114 RepID=UPI0023F7E783|nr:hypothetical protein [Spongiactinospora sp. TRM90649]MDF5751431.1 hypothetical protein [Spongiactinospora sp. TRM90649]
MGIPIVCVVAARPIFALDAATYRTALLVAAGWAVLYLLLALDPAPRDKIDTARSLLTSAPGSPSTPSGPTERAAPRDDHRTPNRPPPEGA